LFDVRALHQRYIKTPCITNTAAYVLKITSGTYAPITGNYSN